MRKFPKIAYSILWLLIRPENRKMVIGDIEEEYNFILTDKNFLKANLWLTAQVLIPIFDFIRSYLLWSFVMFKNYMKISIRNMKKNKGYAFINTSGMAVGMTCCILMFLWIFKEISYDTFHNNLDQLFIVVKKDKNSKTDTAVPVPLAHYLKDEYPEIVYSARLMKTNDLIIDYGEKVFYENTLFLADEDFFNIFSFPFILGMKEQVFKNPNSIVITEKAAVKYFGDSNPLGNILRINNEFELTVSGVLKNIPSNSYLEFDFLIPFSNISKIHSFIKLDNWRRSYTLETYVQISENTETDFLIKKISSTIKRHIPGSEYELSLEPFKKLRYYSPEGELSPHMRSLIIFSSIAIMVLFVSCINFINLSTARSIFRTREIGIRKVVGAKRSELFKQFIGESVLLSVTGLLFGFAAAVMILPKFNLFTGNNFILTDIINLNFILSLFLVSVLAGIFAGIYPAIFVSSFNPVNALQNNPVSGIKGSRSRKIMVTIQFTFSIFLIISTIIIFKQSRFLINEELGFNQNNIINFSLKGNLNKTYETFKNELLKDRNITGVTRSLNIPGLSIGLITDDVSWMGKKPEEKIEFAGDYVDYNFFDIYQMESIKGEVFSEKIAASSIKYAVINETTAKIMNMENPVGQKLYMGTGEEYTILGVINNYHHWSLKSRIYPMMLLYNPSALRVISIKIDDKTSDMQETVNHIKDIWSKYIPEFPFTYRFTDDLLKSRYNTERKAGIIFGYFAFIAVFISCMGLLGIASFTVKKRSKEVGIRKIFGSSTFSILLLLSKDYIRIVLVSNFIAIPLAYFAVNLWLNEFAFRIKISPWIFILSGLTALIIAFFTILHYTLKAASLNPVEILRNE
ncbi:ABC transporter permease [candidate division KSB1 bacterium]